MFRTENKILDEENLRRALARWRFKKMKIVFTNGCFDILHLGHADYLERARALGDVLIVGLNTDASVKRLKGANRPVQDERSRARVMASLVFVDAVVLFNEDTPYELIKKIQPDILAKGKDYEGKEVAGSDIAKKVVLLDLVEGYSTSKIAEKLK